MESGLGFSVGPCLTRNVLPLPRGAVLLFSVQHPAVKLAAVYLSCQLLASSSVQERRCCLGKKCLTSSLPKIHPRPKANFAQNPILEDEASETAGAVPHVLPGSLLIKPLTSHEFLFVVLGNPCSAASRFRLVQFTDNLIFQVTHA